MADGSSSTASARPAATRHSPATLRAAARQVGMVFQFHLPLRAPLPRSRTSASRRCTLRNRAARGRGARARTARVLGVEHRADALPRELVRRRGAARRHRARAGARSAAAADGRADGIARSGAPHRARRVCCAAWRRGAGRFSSRPMTTRLREFATGIIRIHDGAAA